MYTRGQSMHGNSIRNRKKDYPAVFNPMCHCPIYSAMMDYPEIRHIIEHRRFRYLSMYRHHGDVSCMEHCLKVASIAFCMSASRGIDVRPATRGALLHDFFFYDWRTGGPRLHGFRHPSIALKNAERFFKLCDIERDAILRHMWPLTPIPPRYTESMIVCIADKRATWREYHRLLKKDRWMVGKRVST